MAALSKELLKKIHRIQIQTTHLANDVLAGVYRSTFKGKGMEFEENREYQDGDDVRDIDWNVTARMQRPYVKSFREERELSVTLVVDISASTRFGSGQHLKSEWIAEIAAVIAFSAIKNHDKIALILFAETIELYIPPRQGTRHVLRIIRELLTYQPKGRVTNIPAALSFLGKVQNRNGICFLISDFIVPDFSHELALIVRKQDLVPIMILDPAESVLPNLDLVNLTDLESGNTVVIDSSSIATKIALKQSSEAHLITLKKMMQKQGVKLCTIQTDKPYLNQLKKYFISRQRKR